ncbi:MAG: GNAT family N-acetyltransferase [Pseudomonadota bacterium]
MTGYHANLQLVEAHESTLIFSFLTLAARMLESNEPIQKALTDKELTKYWQGWGRASDLGVVALRDDSVPVSCAWLRQLPAPDAGYVAEGVLELAIGTVASERGMGIGTRVLGRLIELCRAHARGISLSVRAENPAVRLYQRFGFRTTAEITNRVGGQSLTMLLDFTQASPTPA